MPSHTRSPLLEEGEHGVAGAQIEHTYIYTQETFIEGKLWTQLIICTIMPSHTRSPLLEEEEHGVAGAQIEHTYIYTQ